MPEIKAELKEIRGVELRSKVVEVKDGDPKVVTQVKFQYEGEPSEMEGILMAESRGLRVHSDFHCEQMPLEFGKKPEPVGAGINGD